MKKQIVAFAILLIVCIGQSLAQNATQANVTGTSSVNTITNNVASAVDNGLNVTANGNISGFIVSITGSYTSGDVLTYTGGLPSGVTATAFNTTTRSLVFSGSTSAANWQTLLRTVTLQTTSAVCNPESRQVSFIAGSKYYNNLNGHFYEIYATSGSWTTAKTYAETQSYFGRVGYLATLTSQAENNFVAKLIGVNSWIGSSDDYIYVNAALGTNTYADQTASEGKFYWVTGPEKGTQLTTANGGSAGWLNTTYQSWGAGEPNNAGTENYGHMYSATSLWNDFANSQSINSIIEYGGMPSDNTTSQIVFARNIYINGAPSGTITGGNSSVCSGTNSTTLTLTGLAGGGTVAKWQYSYDDFLTAGVDIANTTTSLTVSNISTTGYYKAVVNTPGCTGLTTSSTPIFVSTTVAGNIVAQNNAICAGSTADFTLFGNSGSIVKWQVSTSSTFASAVTDIANTTTSLSYTLPSAGTFYFRAVVQNSGCGSPVNTPGYTITVTSGTSAVGGAVSNAQFCGGSNAGTLTLTGSTGTVQKWQFSVDGGTIWTDVANTTTSLSYTAITANTTYRAILTSGACGIAYSTPGTITVFGTTVNRWDGGTNNDWGTASNWCGGVPAPGVDISLSATAANDLVLDQDRTVGNIAFNGGNRKIVLGSYTLSASSTTGANSSNYIQTSGAGKMKVNIPNGTSFTFPVSKSAYNPVSITNNSGSADYFSVLLLDEVYANGASGAATVGPRIARTWDITKTNANAGSGINIVLNWNNGESVGTITSARLYHFDGTNWIKQTGTTSSTANSLTYTGYTGTFSPFAIGDNLAILPVTWLGFTAKKQLDKVALNWSTAEQGARDYVVQFSTNGTAWQTIGNVTAVNNNSTQSYDYTHTSPVKGINYYRIMQRDVNGNISYSAIVSVAYNDAKTGIVVYPNPVVNGKLNLQLDEAKSIQLYNSAGTLMLSKQLAAGIQQVDVSTMPKGIYKLKANGETISVMIQ